MILQERIALITRLGGYIKNDGEAWRAAKEKAFAKNPWFTPEFIAKASIQIAENFTESSLLENWVAHYRLDDNITPKNIGIVMAGNIPLVGFHDLLSVFISGHHQTIKLSSKDDVLLPHLAGVMQGWNEETAMHISFAEMLKGCDAYIATGSNNAARAFDEYFGKYPNIIRRNRTAVAVLTGDESTDELNALSDDIHLYFGFGCRNVTKIFVPRAYDFIPLLQAFNKYERLGDHYKYKNNFDYQLSLLLLNKVVYMTNGTMLLAENTGMFAPVSLIWYEFYEDRDKLLKMLAVNKDIQCIVGNGFENFGRAQCPGLSDYADGVDTMEFLLGL